ncbi:MAG: hypothetical protein IJ852_02790 [Alphaproteobacteria bacterium]|nr:hypothetical protein [Alphaproteobacteria bacterium]
MEFLKLSSLKIKIVCLFLLFLGGCSLVNPYIDRRRNAGAQDVRLLYSGPSRPEAPVVCYNALISNDDVLQKLADEECVKQQTGSRAELIAKKHFEGKLLLPSRAYYKCVK